PDAQWCSEVACPAIRASPLNASSGQVVKPGTRRQVLGSGRGSTAWDSLSLDSKLNLVFVWLGITRGGVYAARSWGQSPGAPERQVARQHRWNLRRPHADLMWPNPTGLNVNPAPVPRVGLSAAATKATVACAVRCPPMSLRKTIFMQMFGRPRG